MLLYVVYVVLFLGFSFGWLLIFHTFPVLWDPQSLLIVMVFGLLVLFGAGMVKDFKNAFLITLFHKKEMNIAKIKRAIDAIELEIRGQIFGVLFVLCGVTVKIIGAMAYEGAVLADAFPEFPYIGLHSVYALVFILLILPLQYRLKATLADYMSDTKE